MQHPDHGHGLRDLELNVISQTDKHARSFPDLSLARDSTELVEALFGEHYDPLTGEIWIENPNQG